MRATPDIDERGTARQAREQVRVEDTARVVGQRQQAHENVGLREKFWEGLRAGIASNAFDIARRAIPAEKRKLERLEAFEHGLAELPEPHDADAPTLRRRDPDLAPDLRLLLADEVQEIAMQRQHG